MPYKNCCAGVIWTPTSTLTQQFDDNWLLIGRHGFKVVICSLLLWYIPFPCCMLDRSSSADVHLTLSLYLAWYFVYACKKNKSVETKRSQTRFWISYIIINSTYTLYNIYNIQKDATEVNISYMLYVKHVNVIKQYNIDH